LRAAIEGVSDRQKTTLSATAVLFYGASLKIAFNAKNPPEVSNRIFSIR